MQVYGGFWQESRLSLEGFEFFWFPSLEEVDSGQSIGGLPSWSGSLQGQLGGLPNQSGGLRGQISRQSSGASRRSFCWKIGSLFCWKIGGLQSQSGDFVGVLTVFPSQSLGGSLGSPLHLGLVGGFSRIVWGFFENGLDCFGTRMCIQIECFPLFKKHTCLARVPLVS